jgi:hypothetical protein
MIKKQILPITGYIQELAGTGYVTETPLNFKDRPPLPPNHERHWRKYRHFYADVMNGLDFVCFTKLIPERKLYDLQATFSVKALAG